MQKNKLHILVLLIAIAVASSSCKKLKYYEFDDADKAWINVYTKGETFQFVSDTGDVRTYSITSTTRGYRKDGNDYFSVAEATVRPTDSLQISFPGGIRALKDDSGFSLTILWPHHPLVTIITGQSPAVLTLGGVTYGDVYVSQIDPLFLDSITNVQRVYYSKSAGFVQFTEHNGQTWTRKN